MNDLVASGAESVSDPDSALMVTNAIASIISGDGESGTGATNTVGLEVSTKAIEATDVSCLVILLHHIIHL